MRTGGIVFGPVPSRRLGMSLGVNNVFEKYCSYSCVYCSAGHTTHLIIERTKFYEPEVIVKEVVEALKVKNVDIVTFVPNGEPTLDVNLGKAVKLLRERIDKPIGIITNSSLIYREDVREDLLLFDTVSLKVDAVSENIWKRINRPHPKLVLSDILDGIRMFSKNYHGKLLIETMLVEGFNDSINEAGKIASFISELNFDKAYIATPIRPPADQYAVPPREDVIMKIYGVFVEKLGEEKVGLLIHPEKPLFGFTNNLVEEIARTIYVHPIPVDYIYKIASDRGLDGDKVVEELVGKGYAKIVRYLGKEFLVPSVRR